MNKQKIIYWIPRILGILYVIFLGIFALDVFIPNQPISYYLINLFMHLIPNFILLIFILIAWKYERVGGFLFLMSFLVMSTLFWDKGFWWMQILLFSPLLVISLLFFMDFYIKKND